MFKKITEKKWFNFGLVLFIVGIMFFASNRVKSDPLDNVSGFAWGADLGAGQTEKGGLGWLSFNCTNVGSNCPLSDYGVTIEDDGDLVGYAWSPHYGWLKFGGLSGFPIGPGTDSVNARVVDVPGSPDSIIGWARFCAGAANSDCSGTVSNSYNGGWDGWLSLEGNGYGVLLNDENPGSAPFSGYAWGGNQDNLGNNTAGVGWVNFSNQFTPVIYEPPQEAIVTLSASPVFVAEGGTTTLTWQGQGLVNSSTGCTATGGAPEGVGGTPNPPWTGTAVSPSGTYKTGPLNQTGTYTYTITCQSAGPGGGTVSADVDVTVGIVLNLEATPSVAFPPTYQTTLDWSVYPPSAQLTNCVATADASGTGWDGPDSIPPIGTELVNVPKNPTKFTLTCDTQTPGITVTDSVSVPRGALTEDVTLQNVACVEQGVTTLSWTSSNVVSGSCEAWSSGSSNWIGSKPNAGTEPGITVPATAPNTTTYRLSCEGSASGDTIVSEIEINELSCATTSGKPYYVEN